MTSPLACPRPPEPQDPPAFPVFASVAPVVASVAIWAITQSPFALVFALLGPIVAIASLADTRRQGKRRQRQEYARFESELATVADAIEAAHERERAKLHRQAPSARELMAGVLRDPDRWHGRLDGELPITLGVGTSESRLEFDPMRSGAAAGSSWPALDELRSMAATLHEAPIVVDARLGIGLCGAAPKTLAAAGAVLIQLARELPPEVVALDADGPLPRGLEWVALLPHWIQGASGDARPAIRFEFRPRSGTGERVVVAAAMHERDLPGDCRVVVRLDGAGSAGLLRHPLGRSARFTPGFASAREAAVFASAIAIAGGQSLPGSQDDRAIPTSAVFAALPQPAPSGSASLAACLGLGAHGPVTVDLVADGPHAVVGGTTGSGKSELLVTWVLAMASVHAPDAVNFLLVDFKGGAAFAPLQGLPHVVGTVTDLNESAATRALESLAAELRHRESFLAEHGARSLPELPAGHGLARLVIVVDEFAALTTGFPALHDLFADLAARGRSLGVHLILCTQRPAGSVRDTVLANCTLRISLRVNNRADSVAVIGEPHAAELPRRPAGRAFVSRGDSPTLVQLALTDAADAALVARRRSVTPPVRRPWLDPLPPRIMPGDLPAIHGSGIVFGLVDRPERQRREPAVYDPAEQGHLLVVGGRRSGKSGALAAIAAAATDVRWVPASVEGAWDVVTRALETVRSDTPAPGLLLIDDVDVLVGRYPSDHRSAFLDAIAALHREGPASGVQVVSAASSMIAPLAGLCEARLVLRMPDRHEHAAAAGSTAGFDAELPPGGGSWLGARVQVALVPPPERPDFSTTLELEGIGLAEFGVVSASPSTIASRLGEMGHVTTLRDTPASAGLEAGSRCGILIGDPDDWSAAWTLFGALRSRVPVLFHACSVTEYRTLSRQRELPPPIASPRDTGWLLHPDGHVDRVRF